MSDFISRKALIKETQNCFVDGKIPHWLYDLITNAPAIEQGDFGISVMKYTEFGIVPDDYKNQASGYRAGWNDCIASVKYVVTTPQQPQSVADALEEAANIMRITLTGRCWETDIQMAEQAIRALIKRNAKEGE